MSDYLNKTIHVVGAQETNYPWGFENKIINALKRLGIKYLSTDFRKDRDKLNSLLMQPADLVLINKGEWIESELIKSIPSITALWYAEQLGSNEFIDEKSQERRKELEYNVAAFDYVFSHDKSNLDIYRNLGAKRVLGLSTAVTDPSVNIKLNLPKIYDITFIGSITPYREKILSLLQKEGYKINIINEWNPVEVNKLYNQSKIVLNIHLSEALNLESRLLEVLGSGSFLLSEELSPNELLRSGVHYAEWPASDTSELIKKIDYYLSNEAEREEIAAAGYSHALEHHTIDKRIEELLSSIDFKMSRRILPSFNFGVITDKRNIPSLRIEDLAECFNDRKVSGELYPKEVSRVMLVNHSLYPLELSGTPLSTLNHILGFRGRQIETAVLFPIPGAGDSYIKNSKDGITIYNTKKLDKLKVFLGEIEPAEIESYLNQVKSIVDDFKPDIIQINDYVFMPPQIINVFVEKGIYIIRNVCNTEELCYRDSPVIRKNNETILCNGPENTKKCTECFLKNELNLNSKEINDRVYNYYHDKFTARFSAVKFIYQNINGAFFSSEAFLNYYSQFVDLSGLETAVIERGLNFPFPRKKEFKGAEAGEIKLAYLGNLNPIKGLDILFKALDQLKDIKNISLEIYGSEADSTFLSGLKTTFPGSIKFCGNYNISKMDEITSGIHAVIIPSYFDTFNRVIREVLYFGVPVIATDFFGASIIKDGFNGIKIKIGDYQALASAIRRLSVNPGEIKKLSEGAVNTKLQMIEEESAEIVSFFQRIMKKTADALEGGSTHDNFKTKSARTEKEGRIKVSIIIPTFNKWDYTEKCLDSLFQTCRQTEYEVLVVDNYSTDETRENLRRIASENNKLKVIENPSNLRFAKANNIGAEKGSGEYIVFLNNDTEVLPGWLEAGINKLESDPEIGIVGAKLIYPDKTIQHCGIYFTHSHQDIPVWPDHEHRGLSENDEKVNYPRDVAAVTGACMFMPRELFLQVGGFDESYEMYFEDIDLCFKVAAAGRRVVYEPKVNVIHYEGKSAVNRQEIDRQNIESSKIFYSKWKDRIDEIASDMVLNQIVWIAPFFNPSGYASEAISFALGLDKYVDLLIRHQNIFVSKEFIQNMPPVWKDVLFRLHRVPPQNWGDTFDIKRKSIVIHHQPGISLIKFPNVEYCIGRTMYETDRIPFDWVDKCNQMDEIWVPSKFNYDTFSRYGVEPKKIFIIPEGIDTDVFDPEKAEPTDLPGKAGFNFLSVFEWTNRKGWDVLLKAYFEAFSAADNVCLFLRTYLLGNYDSDTKDIIRNKIQKFIIDNGFTKKSLPRIELLTNQLPFNDMIKLYKSVDAFVLPSRGEGWGRPYMEAMAMGLPVIGTNWSGNTEFMTVENSYLINVEKLVSIKENEISSYLGHKWAQPSVAHLKQIMLEVFNNPEEAKAKGIKARKQIIENFNTDAVARVVVKRLKSIEKKLNGRMENLNSAEVSPEVLWEGPQFVNHSLGIVNREICFQLYEKGVNLSILKTEHDSFTPGKESRFYKYNYGGKQKIPEINVRHQWPPNLTPPQEGRWVVIQPWEYGSMPKTWAGVFSSQVDEVWVPSSYVRNIYLEAGLSPERVFVVPNGYNPQVFSPSTVPYKLKTKKKFKFLFVGGTIYRKGIDVLIEAYTTTFNRNDDLCLVIKDFGGDTFYKNQTIKDRIKSLRKNSRNPEIEYINQVLSEEEIAGLYTACDVLVHPYRGEGFGMPVLEAMASGRPVIVTKGGAADDFCTEETCLFIESAKRTAVSNMVDSLETVGAPWLLEPSLEDLKVKLSFAYMHHSEMPLMGWRAYQHVQGKYTWQHTAEKVIERISELAKKPIYRLVNQSEKNNESKLAAVSGTDYQLEIVDKITEIFGMIDAFIENLDFNSAAALLTKVEVILSEIKNDGIEPLLSEFSCLKGYCNIGLNNLEEAKTDFEEALKFNASSSEACRGLGELYLLMDQPDNSKVMFEWAVKNHPSNKKAVRRLEEINLILGYTAGHNSLMNIENIFEEVYRLYSDQKFQEALEILNVCESEIIASLENNNEMIASYYNLKGFSLFGIGGIEEAKLSFEKALELNPASSKACYGLGEVFYNLENPEAAKTMLEWAVKNDPEDQPALEALRRINKKLNLEEFDNSLTG